jgi:hypothetical protein
MLCCSDMLRLIDSPKESRCDVFVDGSGVGMKWWDVI